MIRQLGAARHGCAGGPRQSSCGGAVAPSTAIAVVRSSRSTARASGVSRRPRRRRRATLPCHLVGARAPRPPRQRHHDRGPPAGPARAVRGVVEAKCTPEKLAGLPEKSRERTTAASASMPGSPQCRPPPVPADHVERREVTASTLGLRPSGRVATTPRTKVRVTSLSARKGEWVKSARDLCAAQPQGVETCRSASAANAASRSKPAPAGTGRPRCRRHRGALVCRAARWSCSFRPTVRPGHRE